MRLHRNADAVISAVAARQYGVIAYRQLLHAGLTQSGIQRRTSSGRLHRIHRGVYAVGHAGLSREGWWKAATLACGPGTALSHRSAAELWGMLEPATGPIHVTVPVKGGRRQRNAVRVHRSGSLLASDVTSHRRIAVTRPQRTLEDLRLHVPAGDLRRALREAEFRRLPVDRFQLVRDRAGNELELDMLALCRRHRLPGPEVNVTVGPFEVDFVWRHARLVVEADGYQAHRGRIAFELDRRRDVWLAANGYFVLRLTSRQIRDESEAVAGLIRRRLRVAF